MPTLEEQVALDVSKGLYSAAVGQQIINNARITPDQIGATPYGGTASVDELSTAMGLNPMQRAGSGSNWGTNVPTTAIATPGSVNVGATQTPGPINISSPSIDPGTAFVLPPSHPNNPPVNPVAADVTPSGFTHGQISDDGKSIYDSSAAGGAGAWVPNPDYIVTNDTISAPTTEAEQYLGTAMGLLDTDGITDTYEDHIRGLIRYYQNGDLTQEQVQSYIDKIGGIAVAQWGNTPESVPGLENFLQGVYDLFSPSGPTFFDRWLEDTLNYTSTSSQQKNEEKVTEIAGTAPDVNGFIEGLLADAVTKNDTWADALNEVAELLWANKELWATANDGAGYPGLVGQIGNLTNPESVKQWLYNTLDDDTKARLGTAHPNKGTDLTNPYTNFATASEPSGMPTSGSEFNLPLGDDSQPSGGTGDFSPTADSPTGTPIPTTPSSGIYDPFFEDAQRSFSTVYDPFTMTQPGYNMPGVQRAFTSARAPLSTQYDMQLPDLQVPGGVGLDPKYQSAKEFLQNLAGGTGRILRGGDLYSRLQDISGALSVDPMSLGIDRQAELYQDRFGTTGEQKAAFAQPFLMATRGSPEARSALMNSINQAAKIFDYQNPQGITTAGGGSQGFLGWAMDNNLLGINDMFTAQQRNPSAWTPQAVEARGNVINPTITGSVATNVDPSQPFAWQDPVEYRDPFSD